MGVVSTFMLRLFVPHEFDMLKRKQNEKLRHESSFRPVLSLRKHSQIRELNYRLKEIQTGMV